MPIAQKLKLSYSYSIACGPCLTLGVMARIGRKAKKSWRSVGWDACTPGVP